MFFLKTQEKRKPQAFADGNRSRRPSLHRPARTIGRCLCIFSVFLVFVTLTSCRTPQELAYLSDAPRDSAAVIENSYAALLMSYINCNNAAQATKILLAQADLIFGLQAVPNRRRVDCFLSAATKHLTQALKSSNSSPKSGSAAKSSFSSSFSYDHRSSSPNAMDEASIAKAQSPMPNAMETLVSISKAQCPKPKAMDVASIAKAQSPMPNAMETLVSIILTFGGTLPKEVEHLLATCEDAKAQCPKPNAQRSRPRPSLQRFAKHDKQIGRRNPRKFIGGKIDRWRCRPVRSKFRIRNSKLNESISNRSSRLYRIPSHIYARQAWR